MIKRLLAVTCGLALFGLAACADPEGAAQNPSDATPGHAPVAEPLSLEGNRNPDMPAAGEELVMLQLVPPQPEDTVVVLHTNMGDISLRFFPEQTPLAYENFITHARDGYYDGVIFHRVINEFMVQGGDPDGTGMGGESIWGQGFGQEFDWGLRHFRGALAMAQSQLPNSLGSQFYIVHSNHPGPDFYGFFEMLLDTQDEPMEQRADGSMVYTSQLFPIAALEKYMQHGGTPFLDFAFNPGAHTVFGHVLVGMDIVDDIANVPVGPGDRPVEDVLIESTTVTTLAGFLEMEGVESLDELLVTAAPSCCTPRRP